MGANEWVTDEDAYECTLSSDTQKVAKDELREDKNTRDQALEQVRNWIKMNPRIENSRMGTYNFFENKELFTFFYIPNKLIRVFLFFTSKDGRFLLRFLRCKKFNVPMAQEAIERYLLLRQVYHPAFHSLDAKEKNMEELIHLG